MTSFDRIRRIIENERGFVIPAILFAVVIMSVLVTAALLSSGDEIRSSRALRAAGSSLYAAEAGGNLVLANSAMLQDSARALSVGDSADYGWTTLPDGAEFRAVLYRYDAGGQRSYVLRVEGRGADPRAGQRVLLFSLTERDPIPVTAALKGGASGANANIRDFATLSGRDTIPPGWAATCDSPLKDVAGLEWGSNNIDDDGGDSFIEGSPPIDVNPALMGQDLFDWGGLNFDDLVAMRDIAVPNSDWDGGIGPTVTGGLCDTTDPWNWGAPNDPASPCFDHFPIIHYGGGGEFRIRDHGPGAALGQGILLVDGDLRIEDWFRFNGIVLVKGDVRFEAQHAAENHIFGAIIAGGQVRLEDNSKMFRYSQCAVRRAIERIADVAPVQPRSWREILR